MSLHSLAGALNATVAGGTANIAGGYCSFAAGRSAHATNDGAFVWGGSLADAFRSTTTNQFLIRAGNGVGINTNDPANPLDVVGWGGNAGGPGATYDVIARFRNLYSGSDAAISIDAPNTNRAAALYFAHAGTRHWEIVTKANTPDFSIKYKNNDKFSISMDGDIEVNGDMEVAAAYTYLQPQTNWLFYGATRMLRDTPYILDSGWGVWESAGVFIEKELNMRTARMKLEGRSYYHCMSRVMGREFLLGENEKAKFRSMMREMSAFSGVGVLTYALMDNHFHLLLEVPDECELSDMEVAERVGYLYGNARAKELAEELLKLRAEKDAKGVADLRGQYLYRMYDVSEFMKTLKQRFTQWYNRKNGRRGTLWEEQRFKSVLVEGDDNALITMAAYIDLNAVRAGIVSDPKDYRFCGYGEAAAGVGVARMGLGRLLAVSAGEGVVAWRFASRRYRTHLFITGEGAFSAERVAEVLASGGALSKAELLRCRVRYFSDGFVLGSKGFVDEVFHARREYFSEKRKSGARRMGGGAWGGLCAARDLRLRVISAG